MKKYITLLFCVLAVLLCAMQASAQEAQAADISGDTSYRVTGYNSTGFLKDKNEDIYYTSKGNCTITLENTTGMGSLYLMFDVEYGAYTITDDTGKTFTAGTNDFIHEYIDLVEVFGAAPASVTLEFANGAVALSEVYVFAQGQVPEFVQIWQPPLDGGADILMLPTHGDDDHLYFAGLLPYYAGELDCAVQVAYLTNHRNDTNVRFHEILNGLWATGVENYPVFFCKWDFRMDPLPEAYRIFRNFGVSDEDLMRYIVTMFRRFKPQVVVGHDINGEYGHGMHKVYADIVIRGVELSNDPLVYPDIVQQYGLWDVPKTYLHSLEDNPIVLDYDVPLEYFDGLTAFQATQKYGFPCHKSQYVYSAFTDWLYGKEEPITKVTQIERHNPARFGLYRTTVGPDVQKNDFLENVTTYAEQARLAQEREEQERLAQEKLEQERLEQERLEQERQEQAQQQQQTEPTQHTMSDEEFEQFMEESIAQNQKNNKSNRFFIIITIVVALVGFELAFSFAKKSWEKNGGKGKRIDPNSQNRKK